MRFASALFLLLLQPACVLGRRVQSAVGSSLQSALSSSLQAGALMLEQYELKSLLHSSDWPSSGFPGFDKISYLGSGAFGETWLAFDKKRKKNVAVKFFYRKQGRSIILLSYARATREEKAALDSAGEECDAPTNIIKAKAFDAGRTRFAQCMDNKVHDQQYAHLVLEVAGTENLQEHMQKGNLSSATTLRIAKMLLEGLVQMEGRYVHRDIKPANVMVYRDTDDGLLYLKYIDFGLITKANMLDGIAGTPMFLPPEAWPIVPRSLKMSSAFDVYSTGETLLNVICGKTFHEKVFAAVGHRGDREIDRALKSQDPGETCMPRSSLLPLYNLVVTKMLPANPSLRASPTALLANAIFDGINTLKVLPKEVAKPSDRPADRPAEKPKAPVIVEPKIAVPDVKKPPEPSFLDKCHMSKKFWFRNAPACCLQERYDPLRHAICERPCGPNVAYIQGKCHQDCQVTSSGSFKFSEELQCCVSLQWNPPKCIYRDHLPSGDGWGWMH